MVREQTPQDYLEMKTLSGVNVSGNGRMISVMSSATYHEKKKPTASDIVLFDTDTGSEVRRFGGDGSRNHDSRFSPDGNRIAYLCRSGEKNELVIVDLATGREERLVPDGNPQDLQWADSTSLYILMTEPEPHEIRERKENGDDGFYFEEEDRFTSLYLYRPGYGIQQLTSGIQVWEFTAGGELIAMVTSGKPQEYSWYHTSISVMRKGDWQIRNIYTPEWRAVARPRISQDGKKIAFLESLWSDRGVTAGDILICSTDGSDPVNITDGMDKSFCDMFWTKDAVLHTLWTRECSYGISAFGESGFRDIWTEEGTVMPIFAPEFQPLGNGYAMVIQDARSPQELYSLIDGKIRRISSENQKLRECRAYPSEVVRWESSDGTGIYGIFRSAGKDRPVVVYVHGGPTSYSPVAFIDRSTYLISRGFSVFLPNYRGSIGKGRKYAEANRGDMGGMDLQDIIAGMDFLKRSGRASTDRWFITGGSYGGFMTAWAITQTDRFSAAVGLFGISDWLSFHGVTNIPDWDSIHYNASPYSSDLYRKFSALYHLKKVKTPVLLMHGVDDPCVPVGQYLQFYRGLKDLGKEVRLLLFPREGHGFTEKKHIIMNMEETVKWFRKYSPQGFSDEP
ncbi:MAG: S9 family peptidase [Thermoplasmataceae archaeon]